MTGINEKGLMRWDRGPSKVFDGQTVYMLLYNICIIGLSSSVFV